MFLVQEDSAEEILSISIYDISGRPILQMTTPTGRTIPMDISKLSAGTYFVKVYTEASFGVEKFLKL